MNDGQLLAPFPYFGGKRKIASDVWRRFGHVKQYIEPFCGSAAILLAAPAPASLEVVNDFNGFIANFWRAVVHQHEAVARAADYPVSHIDLGARHRWLMEQRDRIGASLQDPHWPGDAQVAGWWLWGQCAWIGAGWCEWTKSDVRHVSDAGMGVQAVGQIPRLGDVGAGFQAVSKIPRVGNAQMWTTCGLTALDWLGRLAARLERVRVVHGDWKRCLNHHYGKENTAVFLDPPYEGFEGLYRSDSVAREVGEWARDNASLRIALCGHTGDYDLPGWSVVGWIRYRNTYNSNKTRDAERIWYSPACLDVEGVEGVGAVERLAQEVLPL